jgi:ABC-type multidrug transport system fused ATPase/permease subunit
MFLIRDWTKAELALISVGRIREYCEIEPEASALTQTELPADWPSAGQVIVDNLTIRYAPGLPKVLDGISFVVNPGEKVAIVGSTGSGKSTLSLALLRLMEASEGSVLIDGIDISSVGLYDLRSRISFVPQDPVGLELASFCF